MTEDLIFAVGDIHGRLDLVTAALGAITERAASAESFRVIFLGDYIDRGPQSRGVVDLMIELSRDHRYVCLKGNHEAMMLRCLTDGNAEEFARWMDNGGQQTLESYDAADWDEAIEKTPAAHLRWMRGLPLTSGDGHRIYVHAGLMPSTRFDRQTEETCLWIRERFLRAPAHQFDGHVVHGHTPTWAGKPDPGEPELLPHRTNLDVAAYATDRLCVGVFDVARAGGPIETIVVEQPAGQAARIITNVASTPASVAGDATGLRKFWRR